MTPRTIYIPTNYNNKLACDCFLHVDLAPRTTIPESQFDSMKLEIRTADNSHPPVSVKLNDILRLPLHQVAAVFTWPSHAMDKLQYVSFLMEQKKELINTDTPMAVYYYQKLTP